MMFGQLFRKVDLMSLVAISTQLAALVQQEYLEPATMSQILLFRIENALQTGLTT